MLQLTMEPLSYSYTIDLALCNILLIRKGIHRIRTILGFSVSQESPIPPMWPNSIWWAAGGQRRWGEGSGAGAGGSLRWSEWAAACWHEIRSNTLGCIRTCEKSSKWSTLKESCADRSDWLCRTPCRPTTTSSGGTPSELVELGLLWDRSGHSERLQMLSGCRKNNN